MGASHVSLIASTFPSLVSFPHVSHWECMVTCRETKNEVFWRSATSSPLKHRFSEATSVPDDSSWLSCHLALTSVSWGLLMELVSAHTCTVLILIKAHCYKQSEQLSLSVGCYLFNNRLHMNNNLYFVFRLCHVYRQSVMILFLNMIMVSFEH